MNKEDRRRRLARDRKRRYRAKRAETARQEQALAELKKEWDVEYRPTPPAPSNPQPPRACKTCGESASVSLMCGDYCAKHGKEIALRPGDTARPAQPYYMPPAPPDPGPPLFNPATDRFRPSWWAVVDPNPAPLDIKLSPRAVARGLRARSVQPDPGVVFTVENGHIDIEARQEAIEEMKRRNTGR